MLRQLIISAIAIVVFLLAIFLSGSLSKRKETPKKPEMAQAAKIVESFEITNQAIQSKITIYGRLAPFEKIELFVEVGGMLLNTGKPFKEGTQFQKGELLVKIDDTEQQLNLRAQRSALLSTITQMMPDIKIDFSENLEAWDNYRKNFDVEKVLAALPTPKTDREKDFVTLRNIYNQFYNIRSLEERLNKYKVFVPFSGELTESLINTGSLLKAGQKIGTLMNIHSYELQASVSLQDLKFIKIGDQVQLKSEDIAGTWNGRISRISNSIDTKTQTVKLYIQVQGQGLRENMFLTGEINASTIANAVEVPRKILVNDSQVYTIVGDSVLALMPVQLSKINESTVLIKGLADNTKLLKEVFPGAFDGMKIRTVQK